MRTALQKELVRVVKDLAVQAEIAQGSAGSSQAAGEGRGTVHSSDGARTYETIPDRRGQVRLLGGMVRSNRPGRLVESLSSAAGAAMATGAFGIFYASIWSMADSSSSLRLALITVFAVTALTGWLIVHNGLWPNARTDPNGTSATLDDMATVVTVLLSVAVIYGGLYLAVLLGSLVVISGQYMQAQLGHPVSIVEYANLAWLSASLGTLAGAMGSNFDGADTVRKATYSGREHERHQLAANEQSTSDPGQ